MRLFAIWDSITKFLQQRRDADYGSLIRLHRSQGEPQSTVKVIQAVIRDKPDPDSLYDYLSNQSGLALYLHDSEFRFEGEYNLGYTEDKSMSILLVPTLGVWALPRRLRRKGWKFVRVICPPTDTRFDEFLGYDVIAAGNARV